MFASLKHNVLENLSGNVCVFFTKIGLLLYTCSLVSWSLKFVTYCKNGKKKLDDNIVDNVILIYA